VRRPTHPTTIDSGSTGKDLAMARSAVCVGINEFKHLPMSSWLAGCVNDANDISVALKKFGFTSRTTTMLRDSEATKEAVMRALTAMVDKAKPGDHLVFSFSSHGTQVPNQPGDTDEPDGLDEVFACYDIKRAGDQWDRSTVIADDELHDLFQRVPEGALLEVLLDTCHSGTGLKDLEELQLAMTLGRKPRFLPPPTPRGLDRTRTIREHSPARTVDRKALVELTKRGKGAKPVLFAACRPDQTASDATFDGRPNGAFTHLFLRSLKDRPDATRAAHLKAVHAGLKAEQFEQRSTLEGALKAKKVGFGALW
jgi:hypothetical protein